MLALITQFLVNLSMYESLGSLSLPSIFLFPCCVRSSHASSQITANPFRAVCFIIVYVTIQWSPMSSLNIIDITFAASVVSEFLNALCDSH